jgi:superfamily II DNA helicase RecQ
MNIAEELAWTMGENVSLRSAQGEASSAIENGEGKILVVIPTGAGKSMLFMLPTSVGVGSVAVVLVPFVTLRHDMKGRSKKAVVPVGEWNGAHVYRVPKFQGTHQHKNRPVRNPYHLPW